MAQNYTPWMLPRIRTSELENHFFQGRKKDVEKLWPIWERKHFCVFYDRMRGAWSERCWAGSGTWDEGKVGQRVLPQGNQYPGRTVCRGQPKGETPASGSPVFISVSVNFASASPNLAVGLIKGVFAEGKAHVSTANHAHFWSFISEPPFWRTTEQGWIKSLAWKPLFTPLSVTHSILQRSSVDLRGEFGPLYSMRLILKTYPKHVNSQTIALQSEA